MSATNRHGLARQPHDFYETPAGCIDAILDELGIDASYAGMVLDPGCGNGIILERLHVRAPKAESYGVDIQSSLIDLARAREIPTANFAVGDFLKMPVRDVDLVIANPPYKDAEAFVRRALECVAKRKGIVAMLLPDGFKGSRARLPLHKAHGSGMVCMVPRPSFNGGGTDSTNYAWFVWGRGWAGRWYVKEWRPARVAKPRRPKREPKVIDCVEGLGIVLEGGPPGLGAGSWS
jgi:SAM-dependent methyltransferase